MYEQFYNLRDKPFSLTPNPRFVFYSQQYHEAEGQLFEGINNRAGFMLVTGQPGTGKTTLCHDLIDKLDREGSQSALIFNPFLNGMQMLAALLTEFGTNVPESGTRKELFDRLNQFLLAQLALGTSCVVIFDEAQHLSPELLEQIRLLSNLEIDQKKLIQIILVGQPELLDKIRTPQMAQLDQRVSIRCTLADLDQQETDRYIHHRLNVAGARGQVRFGAKAVIEIYRGSHGVPRLINLICDRALLAGYAGQSRDIQPLHVRKAIAALRGEDAEVSANARRETAKKSWARRAAVVAVVAVVAAVTAGVVFWPRGDAGSPGQTAYNHAIAQSSAADGEAALTAFLKAYPASNHTNDALERLAQLEVSRGDRASAIQHWTQLAQRTPTGAKRTQAIVSTAAAQLAGGDTTSACLNISSDLTSTATADTSLTHRLTSVASICAARQNPLNAISPADSATRVRDSIAATRPAKRGAELLGAKPGV